MTSNSLGLSNRGNPRLTILEAFANANDKLIENYGALARRDLAKLKSVGIAGYTSAAGTAEHNQQLSERRATAIKNYLVTEGDIAKERLSVIGYGDTRPGSYEATPTKLNSVAARENMRAPFEIIVE